LCQVTLKFAETSVVKSRPTVLYGANLSIAYMPRLQKCCCGTI